MPTKSPSQQIDQRIREVPAWQGEVLGRVRRLIKQAEPDVVEEWKWRGVPVWEHDGIICTGETYKDYVKLTFAKGASLPDPKKLFNASLEGNARRAIDIREGDKLDQRAFTTLVKAAAALNGSSRRAPAKAKVKPKATKPTVKPKATKAKKTTKAKKATKKATKRSTR